MSDVRVRTSVVIKEVISERTYRAALRNGKVIFAFMEKSDRLPAMIVGDRCSVLLSLCDFSEGRIVPEDLGRVRVENPIIEGDAVEVS
jgi:translation initiation factor IF-1